MRRHQLPKSDEGRKFQEGASLIVQLDGDRYNIPLQATNQSILEAALAGGADLPFSCKGGVCCTCRAKVVMGEVEMKVNYALEEDEVKEGYVLTCQSYPKTDFVQIDFDA